MGEHTRSFGICREACRDDDDCPEGDSCDDMLDPENSDWSGCVAPGNDL